MPRRNHTQRPTRQQQRDRQARQETWNTRTRGRSGRMPITLIDGSSIASAAQDIQVIAASMHTMRPCYAQRLQVVAAQIAAAYDATAAAAAWTDTPTANRTASETALSENTLTETALSERTLSEPPV